MHIGYNIRVPRIDGIPIQIGKEKMPEIITDLDLGGNKTRREGSTATKTTADLKKDLRGWAIGLIIWGMLSFIFTQYFDPVWGGVIIILGIVNFFVINRAMYIVNGLALIFVGILNIIAIFSRISILGISSFWISYGVMQIIWGFREIIKFVTFSTNPAKPVSPFPVRVAGKIGRFIMFPVERQDIEFPSIVSRQKLDQAIDGLARVWIAEDRPGRAELTISGYDNAPRELYEIPEVCGWANRVAIENPVLPFFLTGTSLDRFTGWLCGPVSKSELTTSEFQERFVQLKKTVFNKAVAESSAYFTRMGANPTTISKFYMLIMTDRDEVIKTGTDGHIYTTVVRNTREMRKIRNRLLWKLGFTKPWVIVAGIILGLAIIAGSFAFSIWGTNLLPKPSLSTPFINIPALSGASTQAGQICWTYKLTNFDGNRSQVWENFLDQPTKNLVPFDQFKEDVVRQNPALNGDGYIFYSQKSYILPELCP